jgi:hypothetical protein
VKLQKPAQARVPVLLRLKLLDFIPFGHVLRAIETLAAFAAAVGAIRKKQQDPKFQKASSFGTMDMVAATEGTISILGIYKDAEYAFHSPGMIQPESLRAQSPRSSILLNR